MKKLFKSGVIFMTMDFFIFFYFIYLSILCYFLHLPYLTDKQNKKRKV